MSYNPLQDLSVIANNNNDKIGPALDVQNTSLENVLRLLIKDKYTKDTFKGVTGFQGIVLRTIHDPSNYDYSQRVGVIKKQDGVVIPQTKYKVWIPGPLYSIFIQPQTFDETPQDKALIDVLPDFSIASNIFDVFAPGDIVWVSFGNIDSFKDPVIEYSFSPIKDNTVSANPNTSGNSPPNPSQAFNDRSSKPISLDKIPEDITEEDAYQKGDKLPEKVKLKPIFAYTGQRMRQDAADKFNEMCKAAANQGVKIIATSGFRSHQTQINIYNERFVTQYPYDKDNLKKKPPSNSFKSGWNAAAAYPGFSNHQNGTAVDIDTIPINTPPNQRYALAKTKASYNWLKDNASNFGFNNEEGRLVHEPWHWVYSSSNNSTHNMSKNEDI